ncbi:MAG: prepilin-type N-terminal cleavage/methylation domain-containing protein [Chlorobium sp.]|nr:prepilin-type N-terminal cleavage/methylation domain-containing protein [Chlorobium sp.]
MKPTINQDGFTLIEAMIAMMLLTIGILPLFTMQIRAINGNATANSLTGASTRALDQIEQILSWNPSDSRLTDTNTINFTNANGVNVNADNSSTVDNYTIYWDGTPLMDPANATQQVGIDLQVHVVWTEAARLKQISMNVTKSI